MGRSLVRHRVAKASPWPGGLRDGLAGRRARRGRVAAAAFLGAVLLAAFGCSPASSPANRGGRSRSVLVTEASLLEELPRSLSEERTGFADLRPKHHGARAFRQPVPGEYDWRVRVPQSRSLLRSELWIEPAATKRDGYVETNVTARAGGGEEVLFSRVHRVGPHWHNKASQMRSPGPLSLELPLEDYAGREIVLRFSSRAVGGEVPDAEVIWGSPLLKAERETVRPNVVLICIDTLRHDRVRPGNAEAPEIPQIAELARDGIVFERATAQSPWTLPSVASVMTGLPPAVHGAGRKLGTTSDDDEVETLRSQAREKGRPTVVGNREGLTRIYGSLGEELRTLPEALEKSYETYFVNSKNGWLKAINLHERFQTSDYLVGNDDDAVRVGNEWVRRHQDGLFLAYYHLMYVHDWHRDLSLDDHERARERYDLSVRITDRLVGRILDNLRRAGIYDDTLVVFWSDHGEHLWDEGWEERVGHGETLSEKLLHVPLILKRPGSLDAGARVPQRVRMMDVFSTVLESAGADVRGSGRELPPAWRSTSLWRSVRGETAPLPIPAGFGVFDDDFRSVQKDGYRLIWYTRSDRYALLDTENDRFLPTGASREADRARRELETLLRDYLEAARAAAPASEALELDEQDRENLKALGYIEE